MASILHVFSDPRCNSKLLALAIGQMLCSVATLIHDSYLPIYVQDELGLSNTKVGENSPPAASAGLFWGSLFGCCSRPTHQHQQETPNPRPAAPQIGAVQGAAQFLCQLSKGVSGVAGDMLGSQVSGARAPGPPRGKGVALAACGPHALPKAAPPRREGRRACHARQPSPRVRRTAAGAGPLLRHRPHPAV
jgi:hypothetical protein